MTKTGVLLINLGTPANCDPKSVYIYLKQFLNDPRVIDLPAVLRYILVNCIIIPLRYRKSAHAYQQIWTEKGSPLLVNSNKLACALSEKLGNTFHVELGMRYGNPSIESALVNLHSCEKIIAIPLFPQYSSAATGSAIQEVLRVLGKQWNIPEIHIIKDFFNHPDFIRAYAAVIQENIISKNNDIILFSYHGLPERERSAYCYKTQCFETSRLLAKELNLSPTQYQTSFQSRLGRTPWIKPYTDLMLIELRQRGIKNIAIACPSFVSDCLETLEEINIRARKQWQELGGNEFIFIPCLNDHALWVDALSTLSRRMFAF